MCRKEPDVHYFSQDYRDASAILLVTIFCHTKNIRRHFDDEGNPERTAWFQKTGWDFNGLEIPLGAAIDYLPPKSRHVEKMNKTTIEGVFLGWKINPGAKWGKKNFVAPLSEFKRDEKKGKNQRTRWHT